MITFESMTAMHQAGVYLKRLIAALALIVVMSLAACAGGIIYLITIW